jgi:hypothetical protein
VLMMNFADWMLSSDMIAIFRYCLNKTIALIQLVVSEVLTIGYPTKVCVKFNFVLSLNHIRGCFFLVDSLTTNT